MLKRIASRPGLGLPAKSFAPPSTSSVGKLWRFRRNLVIYLAWRTGLNQRLLADVFDLPRSRIGTIVQEFRKLERRQTVSASDREVVETDRFENGTAADRS